MLPCVVSLLECAHRELVANLEDALCCLRVVLEQNRLEKQVELHGLAQFFFLHQHQTPETAQKAQKKCVAEESCFSLQILLCFCLQSQLFI